MRAARAETSAIVDRIGDIRERIAYMRDDVDAAFRIADDAQDALPSFRELDEVDALLDRAQDLVNDAYDAAQRARDAVEEAERCLNSR